MEVALISGVLFLKVLPDVAFLLKDWMQLMTVVVVVMI